MKLYNWYILIEDKHKAHYGFLTISGKRYLKQDILKVKKLATDAGFSSPITILQFTRLDKIDETNAN